MKWVPNPSQHSPKELGDRHNCPPQLSGQHRARACAYELRTGDVRAADGKGLGWIWTFCRRDGLQLFDGTGNLQVFELELKLLDLAEHPLALRAEEHPLQLLDQQHEAFDLACPRGEGAV